MQKSYSFSKSKIALIAMFTITAVFSNAQITYRHLTGFGTALIDINDSGYAVLSGASYDYLLNNITPMDTDVVQLNGINNNGDLIGMMPIIISGQTLYQPAYKRNGTWYPVGLFPNAGIDAAATVYQISENGTYIAGQMSPDCCDFQAFLYNTVTDTLERIANPTNEYGAAYCVNDSGYMGGWYDPQPVGTLRVPALMSTGSVISSIPPAMLPSFGGQVSAINNSNVMVGDFDGAPFIYDLATNTYTTFTVPANYQTATFTSVSENGIAVGYSQIFDFGTITRDAIIYHPQLGAQPVFIKDILAAQGLYVPTFDSLLGTAIAISPDGNYVCGWENGQFFFASGWAVHFNDSLLPTFVSQVKDNQWSIYPNPSKDLLTVKGKENIVSLRVLNGLLQEKIKLVVNNNFVSINLSELASGIYFVEIKTKDGVRIEKVIRE